MENDIEFLEYVIAFVEKTADKRDVYYNYLIWFRFIIFMLCLIFIIFIFIMWVVSIPFLFMMFVSIRKYKNIKFNYNQESKILSQLFDLTHEFKQLVFNAGEINRIQKMIIDMKLSRINFFK